MNELASQANELAGQLLRAHPKPRLKERALFVAGMAVVTPAAVVLMARYGLSRLGAKRRNRK